MAAGSEPLINLQLSERATRHRVVAMIGPVPSLEPSGYLTTPHNAARVLAKPSQLGDLRLLPGERQLVEYVRTLYAGGWQQSVFWPIHVEGTTASDSWPVVQREAARVVHTLVCLLSLAWNEALQVRVGLRTWRARGHTYPKTPARLPLGPLGTSRRWECEMSKKFQSGLGRLGKA